MSKLDDFKLFVSKKPEFVNFVRDKKTSWQKLYELYDIYGEDDKIWDRYLNTTESSLNIKGILNTIKNINLDALEENINNIQKAVGLVEELTKEEKKDDKIKPKREKIDRLFDGENEK